MPRSAPCFSLSGRYRSRTSVTEPNSMSVMAWRSNSFVAQAYISSSDLGGCAASNRPSARVGA